MMKALDVQGRVIKALFLREMKTRFGEKRLGFLWAFIEPAIHVIIIISIWKIFGRLGPPGIHPVLFIVTGVIPFIMFNNILNKTMQSIAGNKALLVFPQIKPIDFIISRIVVEFTTYGVVFIAFIYACKFLGFDFYIEYPLGVFSKFVLMALLGGGLGYLFMPLISTLPFLEHFVRFLQRALYLSSGVIFSIEKLPASIRHYLDWNPILQTIHMLRADFFPQMELKPEYSNVDLVTFVVALLWLFGIILTKRLMIQILRDK